MGRDPKNVAASVRQRLLNTARASGRPFNDVLQRFAMERFLYRLAASEHGERFVLKGALMMVVWEVPASRPTLDIDLLGQLDNEVEALVEIVRDVCLQVVEPDGMSFDVASLEAGRIAEDAEYAGVRVRFLGTLGTARVHMQLDVGFGDVVYPAPVPAAYPTLLDLPAPLVRGYTRESIVAEKLHAMFKRGLLNSRVRDYFDIWLLSHQFEFDALTLAEAIRATFDRRRTLIRSEPVGLTDAFAVEPGRRAQWQAFLRKGRFTDVPNELHLVVERVASFLLPILDQLQSGGLPDARWSLEGRWVRPAIG